MTAQASSPSRARRIILLALSSIVVLTVAIVGLLVLDEHRGTDQTGEYVSLGSSFAAGPQLGPLVANSPYSCWRTQNNYAQQFARRTGFHLVDASCGGATTKNILEGGPLFMPPQIDSVGPSAKLVTVTIGGNDVSFAGDLGLMAWRGGGGVLAALTRLAWSGPKPADARPYAELEQRLEKLVALIRQRAPEAKVVLLTYPRVLPKQGSCAGLGLTEEEASTMREVEARLTQTIRRAAVASGAMVLDIDAASEEHDSCSANRWVNGASAPPDDGAMFHPNRAGMQMTAALLEQLVKNMGILTLPVGMPVADQTIDDGGVSGRAGWAGGAAP